ncbi:molybdopterin synthase sulfur carrier subunit [Candidatus Poribacteria bacterium]|nr:MAG: molybdopterin synthase sulfur carrier subunit [Candidatus Poribacteria bacterium]
MPVIVIPSLIRNLTNGEESVPVEGATIREIINNLEEQYPGTKVKFCDGDRIRPGIGVYINGVLTRVAMHDRVDDDAELHFLPAISGGVVSN